MNSTKLGLVFVSVAQACGAWASVLILSGQSDSVARIFSIGQLAFAFIAAGVFAFAKD